MQPQRDFKGEGLFPSKAKALERFRLIPSPEMLRVEQILSKLVWRNMNIVTTGQGSFKAFEQFGPSLYSGCYSANQTDGTKFLENFRTRIAW